MTYIYSGRFRKIDVVDDHHHTIKIPIVNHHTTTPLLTSLTLVWSSFLMTSSVVKFWDNKNIKAAQKD